MADHIIGTQANPLPGAPRQPPDPPRDPPAAWAARGLPGLSRRPRRTRLLQMGAACWLRDRLRPAREASCLHLLWPPHGAWVPQPSQVGSQKDFVWHCGLLGVCCEACAGQLGELGADWQGLSRAQAPSHFSKAAAERCHCMSLHVFVSSLGHQHATGAVDAASAPRTATGLVPTCTCDLADPRGPDL